MFARLKGTIAERSLESVVLDVQGVGYEVSCSATTFAALPAEGAAATLHIHTNVREDAIQLFGFWSKGERALFRVLLTVAGVGPRVALAVLGSGTAADVAAAIIRGDTKTIQQAQGIGRRLADRIVAELNDKVVALNLVQGVDDLAGDGRADQGDSVVADLRSALTNLGFTPVEAERAIHGLAGILETETRIEELVRLAVARRQEALR